jgi:uncharacterized membrane protein
MQSTWLSVLASYLHVIAVATYLGGSIAMEFVLGPAQKFIPPAQAQVIGQKSADKFLMLVWGSLILFPISGMLLFFAIGDQHTVSGTQFFTTTYGRTLFAMMFLWAILVVNGLIITFVYRPILNAKASSKGGSKQVNSNLERMQKAAKNVSLITRIDLGVALFIVLLGVSMVYGNGIL